MIIISDKMYKKFNLHHLYLKIIFGWIFSTCLNQADALPVKGGERIYHSLQARDSLSNENSTTSDDDVLTSIPDENVKKKGFISSVWSKISNLFSESTAAPSESDVERLSEIDESQENPKRFYHMIPPDTRRGQVHHDVRRFLAESEASEEKLQMMPYSAKSPHSKSHLEAPEMETRKN